MRRLAACCITLALVSLFGAAPWKLVLKDGTTVECDGAPLIVNDVYMFRTADGKDGSLPADRIDPEKTKSINKVVPAQGKWRMISESVYEPPGSFTTLSDGNFDAEVLQSRTPVLVEFWATWCGFCRKIEPTVQSVATDYAGRLKVARLDIDRNSATAHRYGVSAVPTLMLFDGGQIAGTIRGAAAKSAITRMLAAAVPSGSKGL